MYNCSINNVNKTTNMKRFIVIDGFGGRLRAFATKQEAKNFIRNKKDCRIVEISIFDVVDECLF